MWGSPLSVGQPPKCGAQAEPAGRELAMAVAALADTVGIALAGGAALGLHRALCPTA